MDKLRTELEEIRERMVLGVALMQQLADLALLAPPGIAKGLESIAVLGHACVSMNVETVTKILDRSPIPLRAA